MFQKLLTVLLCLSFISGISAQDSDDAILGGQIYRHLHRSTQEEFAERKKLYCELVNLANANRQRDSITLNMKVYRQTAEKVWNSAYRRMKGQVRSIPVCEELIPAEHQVPEKKKETYYKQASAWHCNFCEILKELNDADRNICLYFSISTEIEMLEKPLYDLSPEIIYTMKNLRGRMRYLRKLYPERSRVGKLIAEGGSERISEVNSVIRRELKYQLEQRYREKDRTCFPPERMKHYYEITTAHFKNIKLLFGDKVDFYPVSEPYLIPIEYVETGFYGLPFDEREELQKRRNTFVAFHKPLYQNFCNYIASLPEPDRTICLYIQRIRLRYLVEMPIRNLVTDTPYPAQDLRLRLQVSDELTDEIIKLKQAVEKLEKHNQKGKIQ